MRTHKIDRLNVRVNEKERAAINGLKAELGLQSDSELVRHLIQQQPQRVLVVKTFESVLLLLDALVKRQTEQTDDRRTLGAIDDMTRLIYEKLRDANDRHY